MHDVKSRQIGGSRTLSEPVGGTSCISCTHPAAPQSLRSALAQHVMQRRICARVACSAASKMPAGNVENGIFVCLDPFQNSARRSRWPLVKVVTRQPVGKWHTMMPLDHMLNGRQLRPCSVQVKNLACRTGHLQDGPSGASTTPRNAILPASVFAACSSGKHMQPGTIK